jgi:hypothetical protein
MYYNVLKKVERSLHNKIKENKLSTTVHLYNLKCMNELVIVYFYLCLSTLISCY